MRYLLTIFFSFLLFSVVFSQPPTDFYFKTAIPSQCKELKKTPSSFQGAWQSKKDTMRSFIITENKIVSQYKHLMILSKSEFNKAGYQLKAGFLYGFSKSDSLPAVMKNDTILFCYISEFEIINLIKETGNEFLTEVSGKLILSQKEDTLYRYSLISIKNGELVLSEVLHEPELKKVLDLTKAITIQNENHEDVLYVADIDKKKMEKFISQGFFNDIQNCQRISGQ
jgi:hypothetical protein